MRSDEGPTVGTTTLEVPGLGSITGLTLNDEITQFLGVPYANIPGRFRRSVLASEPWKDNAHDGTRLGPYCPQPPRDFYPVPSPSRPWLSMPVADELNCLNLNISIPGDPVKTKAPLPVLVFLHGGAFTYAMNSSPIYDGRMLAHASERMSQPTIVVTVNYRLGAFGFLAGTDIREYNKSHGEEGVGNYGVWDQVLALRWIQKHISAFGGDPDRVCLFGQSAGSVSVNCHLLRDEPLFSSGIMQSGLIRLCGVMTPEEYQVCYEKMLSCLDISLDLPPAERVERLIAKDASEINGALMQVFKIPVVTMALCDDQCLLPMSIRHTEEHLAFKVPTWCQRIMMGDCRNECIIWNKSWDDVGPEPMVQGQDLSVPDSKMVLEKAARSIGPASSKALAELYGISEDSPSKQTLDALERMTTHGMYSTIIHLAQKKHPELYAYHFDVPSCFENAWGGLAHHSYDNVLIWGVLRHLLPPEQQKAGDGMAKAWIDFANGAEPWERLDVAGRRMIFAIDGAQMKSEEQAGDWGYSLWHELESRDLVRDLHDLSHQLCLRHNEVVSKDSEVGQLRKEEKDLANHRLDLDNPQGEGI